MKFLSHPIVIYVVVAICIWFVNGNTQDNREIAAANSAAIEQVRHDVNLIYSDFDRAVKHIIENCTVSGDVEDGYVYNADIDC